MASAAASLSKGTAFQSALHDAGDQRYVTLSLELRGWDFIKHQFRMRVDTPMYTIKRKLVEKHGRMSELTLYKSIDAKSNAITSDKWTLQEIGIDGAPRGAPEVTATIIYDFKPYSHDEPVLLAAHTRDVVKVTGTPGPSPSRAAYAVPADKNTAQRPPGGGAR